MKKNISSAALTEKKERHGKRTPGERREAAKTGIFLIPSLIGVLVFFILPFFVVMYYSLIDNVINKEFVGLDNYIRIFDNVAFIQALKNTGIFSLLAVPLAILLPLLLALLLAEKIPGRSIFRTVFLSPLMVPVASVVLIWQVLFHQNGVVNDITALFGAQAVDWLKSDYSRYIIIALYLWKNIGYNMILFMAALGGIPKDSLEAATLDGAGAFRKFFRIKLPYLASSILFVGILSLINSFKIFREVYMLTGDYPYDALYLLQHFMNNTFKSLDYPKLSCAAVIICAIMAVIIGILLLADKKLGRNIEE